MAKITMKQIADKAGVSLATVSRIINDSEGVTAEKEALVLHAMKELGYSPANIAGKKPRKTENIIRIGVLATDIENSSIGRLLSGIFSVTDNYDVEIILRDYKLDDAKRRKALEMFIRTGVDGIISVEVDDYELSHYYSQIANKKIPLVLVSNIRSDIEHEGISIVCNDTVLGAQTGYRYLQSLGHENIMILGAPGDKRRFRYRILAIKQDLQLAGKRLDDASVVDCKNSYQAAYMTIDRLCKEGKFNYTAIFAMSDIMAFGAIEALKLNSIAVGEDVSVLGYDDLSSAEYMGLSSMAEPMFALGTNAAYMVMDLVNHVNTEPRRVTLQDSLQIRGSCQRRR